MRTSSSLCVCAALLVAIVLFADRPADAKRTEAIRGRKYTLTKQHGPYMIVVATFNEPPKEARTEGMSPEQAADELVYELRQNNIPAYTFSQQEVVDELDTVDRMGRRTRREYRAQQGGISVLAGNYKSNDPEDPSGKTAQQTLAYVKKFRPKFLEPAEKSDGILQKVKGGGIYRKTPGQPSALSGAFLTINPLLSPEEANMKKRSPLLLKLNSGMENSLLENNGKFTLIVASFHGKSVTKLDNDKFAKFAESFEVGESLDDAAYQAWELARALRQHKNKIEAYVWHDQFSSYVTVGSFDSPNDARIAQLQQMFGAKQKPHPQTGQELTVAEIFTIPANPAPGTKPERQWMFDPTPKVMEVPRL